MIKIDLKTFEFEKINFPREMVEKENIVTF